MITKAIIPVAGWGTRRLPITKAIEKCMLPVGNRPIVDYVVQDCINAGITDIYFVVSEGATQLRQYYSDNVALTNYLRAAGRDTDVELIATPQGINFHYIEQPAEGKYGTAIPVALVASEVADGESVVVLGGDDFTYSIDGTNDVQRLIDGTPENGNAMLAANIPKDQTGRYGVLEVSADQSFIRIVEKPRSKDAPSTLINISKYVFNYDVIARIADFALTERQDEYYVTDAINEYVNGGGSFKVVEAHGEYLDGGNTAGWLHANRVVLGDLA